MMVVVKRSIASFTRHLYLPSEIHSLYLSPLAIAFQLSRCCC